MTPYIIAFAVSFFFIGLKSIQQLNVVYRQYWWILPTSMLMATCEVAVVAMVAKNGWGWIVLAVGGGGGLGSMLATCLHHKITKGEKI